MGTVSVAWGKSLGFTLPCGINHTLLLMASWAFYLTNTSDIINFLCLLLSFLGTLKMCWFWPVAPKILWFWRATARHPVVCDLQRTASLYCTTCQTNTSVAVTWDGGNGPKNQAHHIAPFSHFLSQAIFFRKKHLTTTVLCQPWLSLHCLASMLLCSISVLPFGRERSQAASARLTCRLFVVHWWLCWIQGKLQNLPQGYAVKLLKLSPVVHSFYTESEVTKSLGEYCRGISLKA